MLYHDPAAKTHDRIGFTLSMALALHAAVILGVGFALTVPKAPSTTRMDITLANYSSDKNIFDADYIAQHNQEASGSASEQAELSTNRLAPLNSSTIKDINIANEVPQQQNTAANNQHVVNTLKSTQSVAQVEQDVPSEEVDNFDGQDQQLLQQTEIASLNAKLDDTLNTNARVPKVRRVSAVATKASIDAEYLYYWQQRIELIGNEHYPPQARELGLSGDVQVLVSVNADGSLHDVKVLQSSGFAILDQAAVRIVRLATPFPKFSSELQKTADRLEIIRTWQFRQNFFSRRKE